MPDAATFDILMRHVYTGSAQKRLDELASSADGFFGLLLNITYLGNSEYYELLVPAFQRNWRLLVADDRWNHRHVSADFLRTAIKSVHQAIMNAQQAANQFSINSLKKLLRLMEEEVERELKQLPSELELLNVILEWWCAVARCSGDGIAGDGTNGDSRDRMDPILLIDELIDFDRIDSHELSAYLLAREDNRHRFVIDREMAMRIIRLQQPGSGDGGAQRRKRWQVWKKFRQIIKHQ